MTGAIDDLLLAHAAGKLAEPVALVVATHLALNPSSRARYLRYEALGGVLLESLEPASLQRGALDRVLARLDEPVPDDPPPPPPSASVPLPRPLRDYLPGPLDRLRWRRYGRLAQLDLPIEAPGYRARLFRLEAGAAVPRHTHVGSELTLVLAGGFQDAIGHYRRGDLALADRTIDHQPVADPDEDCLCLTVTDAPLRLTGALTRFLNPFIRI
jgi:putative transcriptional regulator